MAGEIGETHTKYQGISFSTEDGGQETTDAPSEELINPTILAVGVTVLLLLVVMIVMYLILQCMARRKKKRVVNTCWSDCCGKILPDCLAACRYCCCWFFGLRWCRVVAMAPRQDEERASQNTPPAAGSGVSRSLLEDPGHQKLGGLPKVPKICSPPVSGRPRTPSPPRNTSPPRTPSPEERDSLLDRPSPKYPHSLIKLPGVENRPPPPKFPGFSNIIPGQNPSKDQSVHHYLPVPGAPVISQQDLPPIPEIPSTRQQNVPSTLDVPSRRQTSARVSFSSDLPDPDDARLSLKPYLRSSHELPTTTQPLPTAATDAKHFRSKHEQERRPPSSESPSHYENIGAMGGLSSRERAPQRQETLENLINVASRAMLQVAQHPDFYSSYRNEDSFHHSLIRNIDFQKHHTGQSDTQVYPSGSDRDATRYGQASNPEMRCRSFSEQLPGSWKGSGREHSVPPPFQNLLPFRPASARRHSDQTPPQSLQNPSVSTEGQRSRSSSVTSPSSQGHSLPDFRGPPSSPPKRSSSIKRKLFRKSGRRGSADDDIFPGARGTAQDKTEEHSDMAMWHPPARDSGETRRRASSDELGRFRSRRGALAGQYQRPRTGSLDWKGAFALPPMESLERLRTPASVLYPIERATPPEDLEKSDTDDDEKEK